MNDFATDVLRLEQTNLFTKDEIEKFSPEEFADALRDLFDVDNQDLVKERSGLDLLRDQEWKTDLVDTPSEGYKKQLTNDAYYK